MIKKTGCIKCGSGEGMLLRYIRCVLLLFSHCSQWCTTSLSSVTSYRLVVYSKGKPKGHAWSYVRNV